VNPGDLGQRAGGGFMIAIPHVDAARGDERARRDLPPGRFEGGRSQVAGVNVQQPGESERRQARQSDRCGAPPTKDCAGRHACRRLADEAVSPRDKRHETRDTRHETQDRALEGSSARFSLSRVSRLVVSRLPRTRKGLSRRAIHGASRTPARESGGCARASRPSTRRSSRASSPRSLPRVRSRGRGFCARAA